jgi:hypothetical protein
MTHAAATSPKAEQTLDPEHPDFFEHCREYAIQLACPDDEPSRDPCLRESAIHVMARTVAHLALDGHVISRNPGAPGHPCPCNGGGAADHTQRRRLNITSGGRFP